jgi:hypothetical protein
MKKEQTAQAGIDYLIAITLFLAGVYIIFYLSTNIIAPLAKERNDKQFIAEAISDYLLVEFGAGEPNIVNFTSLQEFLNQDYDNLTKSLGYEGFSINISIKDTAGNTVITSGKALPELADFGYVKRFLATPSTSERFVLEVFVW